MFRSKGIIFRKYIYQIYWERTLGYGWFIYKWDLFCRINWFILRCKWRMYRRHFLL